MTISFPLLFAFFFQKVFLIPNISLPFHSRNSRLTSLGHSATRTLRINRTIENSPGSGTQRFQTGAKYLIQDKAEEETGFSMFILIFSKGKDESFISSVTGLTP